VLLHAGGRSLAPDSPGTGHRPALPGATVSHTLFRRKRERHHQFNNPEAPAPPWLERINSHGGGPSIARLSLTEPYWHPGSVVAVLPPYSHCWMDTIPVGRAAGAFPDGNISAVVIAAH
jgi:hypothetical protein